MSGDERFVSIARRLGDSRVLFSEPMANHTSFRIGGPCDLLVLPDTVEDAVLAWTMCRDLQVPCHIVGNGTNLLVKDGGIRGCLIKMAPGLTGIEKNGSATLFAKSGTLLPKLVEAALENELSGLEFAVGIPGSVGGAVAMNAGAYGGDFGSLVTRVQAATLDDGLRWFNREDLQFSYRHSLFQSRSDLLVLGVELGLAKGDRKSIYELMISRAKEREQKQPLDKPSAGSAFRRPPGHYVGSMIDALCMKGLRYGGAQVSERHAGFIVNAGNATAKDVLTLMSIIQGRVKEAFGVDLEPEVMVIGEDLSDPPQSEM
jgi:UDP-N-acetylmuramate dehydrogenase